MIIYRTDVDMWSRIDVGTLSDCLAEIKMRYGDEAILNPNRFGNLLILTPPGENIDRSPSENGVGMFYCGYIDTAVGDVVWETDGPNSLKNQVDGYTQIDGGRRDIPVHRHPLVNR